MAWSNIGAGGGENVTPEVQVQNPLVDQIIAELQGKVVIPPELEEKTATPSAEDQIITPTAGKYLSKVTVTGDSDFTAENIKKDVSIWGITGTYESPLSSYGIDFGTVTPTGSSTLTVNHNLGKIPSFYAVMPKVGYDYDNASIITVFAWIFNARLKFENGIAQNGANISLDDHSYDVDATKNTITFDCGNYSFSRGVEHIWIAIE